MRTGVLLALLSLLACGGGASPALVEPVPAPGPESAVPAEEPPTAEEDQAALLAAAGAYVQESRNPGVGFELQPHAQEGDFALLLVIPEIDEAENALLLMKREGGTWRGVHLDTALDCDALTEAGAPESLCEKL
jgi:hypothetical protein